jgi:hypothetical protein
MVNRRVAIGSCFSTNRCHFLFFTIGVVLQDNTESTLHTTPGCETSRLRSYKVGRPGREEKRIRENSGRFLCGAKFLLTLQFCFQNKIQSGIVPILSGKQFYNLLVFCNYQVERVGWLFLFLNDDSQLTFIGSW